MEPINQLQDISLIQKNIIKNLDFVFQTNEYLYI